jgi:hypothetical protein
VRLSIAFDAIFDGITATLKSSKTNWYGGFRDPSTPAQASLIQYNTSGESPKLGDGSSLPNHGEYGAGVNWLEFDLGDFTLKDSHLGDFIGSFPTQLKPRSAQINVYEISINKQTSETVRIHLDLYNHVQAGNNVKYTFAPFSHDGGGTPGGDATGFVAPEPSSVALLCFAPLGLLIVRRRRGANLAVGN